MEIQCGSWLACEGGASDKGALTDTPPSQASQLPQGLCAMQALQRSVGECFGAVDQVLGGAGHVTLITAQPLGSVGSGGGCATQQVADLREGVFEAEILVHGEGGWWVWDDFVHR